MTGVQASPNCEYITTITICLTPTSRSSVTIASSDLADAPIIDVNFNATELTPYVLREGLKKNVGVIRGTESGQSFVADEALPNGHQTILPDSADEVIEKRIRDFGLGLNHPCGSCAMGKVVNSECKVMGAQGLGVVDASIIPVPIAAHTKVSIYALSEKAVEMIGISATDSAS